MGKKKVQSTLSRLTGAFWVSKDGELKDGDIEIGSFEGPTAVVRISGGATVNMGNYQTSRIEVGIEMPCYPEEVPEVYRTLQQTIEAKLKFEVDELMKAKKGL